MVDKVQNSERLFQHLDDLVADIIDRFASDVHGTAIVIATLQDVLAKRQAALDRYPDPTEDPVDEPSNDWPSAGDRHPEPKG